MSSVSIPSSFAVFNTMSTISIPKDIAAFHRHSKIKGNAIHRSASILMQRTTRLQFRPSAMMVEDSSKDVRPVTVTYAPSMWGDSFSTFSFDEQVQNKFNEEIETLKEATRSTLMAATLSTKLLVLIDTLERLGLAYHFETEIQGKLKQIYDSAEMKEEDHDLFTTALRFRLLRQHQYHVSCSMSSLSYTL